MQMKPKKDENTGTYWFVANAGKDQNGKRLQIKRRGFRTEKDAVREWRKVLHEVDNNSFIKNTKLKYCDFLENEWLESKALNLRIVTYGSYSLNIKKHIIPYFKTQEIGKITTQMIEKFYAHLSKISGLSERSIQDIHKIIKNSFKTAFKRKHITSSPAEEAQAPKVPRKEMMVWNLEQTVNFLKTASDNDLYIAFLLALTTGMRQSELLGLRWKDIDFDKGVLHVRQTLSHDGKRLYQETKTKASARTISLTAKAIEDLKSHHKIVKEQINKSTPLYKNHNLVICTKNGTPVNPRNLLRVFYGLMEKAKVPKIRFHDLRHTVATLMLSQNINPKIVKEILGHSDIRTTLDTYSHVLPSVHKETAKQFGEMLFDE